MGVRRNDNRSRYNTTTTMVCTKRSHLRKRVFSLCRGEEAGDAVVQAMCKFLNRGLGIQRTEQGETTDKSPTISA